MSIASVLESLRKEYEPALKEEIKNLDAALERQDWAEARRIAHRVGGTAGSYGFKDVSVAARTIELAIEKSERDGIASALAALKAAATESA